MSIEKKLSKNKNGKTLEIIVAQLERLLSDNSIKITQNDKIYDHVAEEEREVDISIKGKFGSSNILIIIECRDHIKKQGSIWIEQINSKTKDLKANGVIAVSTSGFYKPAYKKAKKYGIELRTLTEFDPLEIKDWIKRIHVIFANYYFDNIDVDLELVDYDVTDIIDPNKLNPPQEISKSSYKTYKPFFIIPKSGKKISLMNILEDINRKTNNILFRDFTPNSDPVPRKISIYLYHPSQTLYVEINNKKYRVFAIYIKADLSIKEKSIHVSRALRYQNEDRIIAEKVDYDWKIKENLEVTLSVQRDLEKQKQNFVVFTKIKDDFKNGN